MKHYRQFLLLLAMLPVGTFAKDNFKMTGKIDGVGNDTLCIEYVSKKTVRIMENPTLPTNWLAALSIYSVRPAPATSTSTAPQPANAMSCCCSVVRHC